MDSKDDSNDQFAVLLKRLELEKVLPQRLLRVYGDFLSEILVKWSSENFKFNDGFYAKFSKYVSAVAEHLAENISSDELTKVRAEAWSDFDELQNSERVFLRLVICGLYEAGDLVLNGEVEEVASDFFSLIFGLLSRLGQDYGLKARLFFEAHPLMRELRRESNA
jgi:hypothetical protein